MHHHWELIRLKLPHKPFLIGFEFGVTWLRHVDWLLGEDILGYDGRTIRRHHIGPLGAAIGI